MLTNRTVFVLGAGAGVPYKFSTGLGLLDKARAVDPLELIGNAGRQVARQLCQEFSAAIRDNMPPSIDALLEHRRDLWPVGKRVIATLLYKEEEAAVPGDAEQDWMALVFDAMSRGADSAEAFARNPVHFITFNYDRYLEYRFIRGLVARYGIDARAAWQHLRSFKFLHLHGSLGPLPEQIPAGAGPGDSVPLGAPETPDIYTLGLALGRIENELRIVEDADGRLEVFDNALQSFQWAQQVIFLGFGFGQANVRRLCTAQIPEAADVCCTAFKMTPAEIQDAIYPAFPGRDNIRRGDRIGASPVRLFLRERIRLLR